MNVLHRRDYFTKIAVCLLYTYFTGGITAATVRNGAMETQEYTQCTKKTGPYKHLGRREKMSPLRLPFSQNRSFRPSVTTHSFYCLFAEVTLLLSGCHTCSKSDFSKWRLFCKPLPFWSINAGEDESTARIQF
jgi:hypothetical protein